MILRWVLKIKFLFIFLDFYTKSKSMLQHSKNLKLIAMKQVAALAIDLSLVSMPLIIAPSLEIFPICL